MSGLLGHAHCTLRGRGSGGLYALCPYILGARPNESCPSSEENNGILLDLHNNQGRMGYGIEAYEAGDLLAWQGFVTADDVRGLPPTMISVNICDPLRDEGIGFYRLLLSAGVPATCRQVMGTSALSSSVDLTGRADGGGSKVPLDGYDIRHVLELDLKTSCLPAAWGLTGRRATDHQERVVLANKSFIRSFIRVAFAAAAALSLVAAGCGSDTDVAADGDGGAEAVSISDAWSREPAEGQTTTAVYGVVNNPTGEDLTIVSASSPVTDEVELHETLIDDDGVMEMVEREEGFVVPAGGEFVFEPGGPHVMLLAIDPDTYPETVEVTFEFDGADPLTFDAEVRAIAGDDAEADMDHSGAASEDHDHDESEAAASDDTTMAHDHATDATHGDTDATHAEAGAELDVSALHEVDEQLATGELNAEAQRAVVADYIEVVEAMEPAAGSAEADLLAALQDLDAALADGDLAAAAPLASAAHDIAHDLGHGHG